MSADDLEAHGVPEVDALIKEAVDFCNDSKRSQKVKDKLAEALEVKILSFSFEISLHLVGCKYAGKFRATSPLSSHSTPYW